MRKDFGPQTWLFPLPVLILGTYDENNNPNAMNAAWGGTYDHDMVIIALSASHKTAKNLKVNKAFSLSFATVKTVASSDYVGIVSQNNDPKKMEKAKLTPIPSEKVNAPLFEEYPVTLECELVSLDGQMGDGGTLIGQIVNVSVDESVLTNGKIDIKKLEPIAFDGESAKYNVIGEEIADAFRVGLKLR